MHVYVSVFGYLKNKLNDFYKHALFDLPFSDILIISSLTMSSSRTFSPETNFFTWSKECGLLMVMLCLAPDSGGTQRDWNPYGVNRQQKWSRDSRREPQPHYINTERASGFTWRKSMWSSVCENCSSSASLFFSSATSCSSCSRSPLAHFIAVFSWARI